MFTSSCQDVDMTTRLVLKKGAVTSWHRSLGNDNHFSLVCSQDKACWPGDLNSRASKVDCARLSKCYSCDSDCPSRNRVGETPRSYKNTCSWVKSWACPQKRWEKDKRVFLQGLAFGGKRKTKLQSYKKGWLCQNKPRWCGWWPEERTT